MITSTPRLSHPAFNPIIFKCEKTGDETQETIVITSEIEEINVSTGLIETISKNEEVTRDYTDDITFINISPSIKRLFYKGPLQEMTEKIVPDKKLFARYSVDSNNYLAINSSLQVKEKQKTSGDVLSYMESFDKYEGYPLDVSILSESGFPSNKGEFEAMSVCRYRVDDNETDTLIFYILLGTSRGNLIMTSRGNFIGAVVS